VAERGEVFQQCRTAMAAAYAPSLTTQRCCQPRVSLAPGQKVRLPAPLSPLPPRSHTAKRSHLAGLTWQRDLRIPLVSFTVLLGRKVWHRPANRVEAGHSAEYARYLQPAKRLSCSEWLGSLRRIPRSRVIRQIRQPLLGLTGVAFLVSIAHCLFQMPTLPTLSAHTLLGSGLSLLLVFRTNTAYQRFQEGRKLWNDILEVCRDLALSASLYQDEIGHAKVDMIRSLLQAFPFVMRQHVQAGKPSCMRRRLQELVDDVRREGLARCRPGSRPAENVPLQIAARLLEVIKSVPNSGDAFTNRERVWLLSMVTKLSHSVGRCERLVQTPVPLSYAHHTTRFVSIWTLTLPFALVSSLGWLTAPVVSVVTWALFGILELGHNIEDPFNKSIKLAPICEAIYHDCERALPRGGLSYSDDDLLDSPRVMHSARPYAAEAVLSGRPLPVACGL